MNPVDVQESWSMGWMIGWPAWIIALLIVLFLAVVCTWAAFDESDGMLGFFGVCLWVAFVGLLILMLSPFGMYPAGGSDFHKWKPKSGEVTQVAKRLVPNGDSMEEKVVIVFKGSTQEYGVTDTRAALVEKGDTVVIKCKKAYDWGSIPGYDCKWIQRIPAGEAK